MAPYWVVTRHLRYKALQKQKQKQKQKLELTWIGKDQRSRLEPRILLEDQAQLPDLTEEVEVRDVFDLNRHGLRPRDDDEWIRPAVPPAG